MLVMRQGRALAGGADRDQPRRCPLDLPLDELGEGLFVQDPSARIGVINATIDPLNIWLSSGGAVVPLPAGRVYPGAAGAPGAENLVIGGARGSGRAGSPDAGPQPGLVPRQQHRPALPPV